MADKDPKGTKQVTWGSPAEVEEKDRGSYWNTINPLSPLFSLTDRVPEWWMKMFPGKLERTGYNIFKTGSIALLATALVAGYRGIKHLNRISEMAEADNPAGKLKSQIGTTFSVMMNDKLKERAAEAQRKAGTGVTKTAGGGYINYPDVFSTDTLLSSLLPVGTMILATGLAYKGADEWANARRNKILDNAIKAKDTAVKEMMKLRAQTAKGGVTEEQLNAAGKALADEDLFIKQAEGGMWQFLEDAARGGTAATGLAGSLLLAASLLGSYAYFEASDPNNLKYKAIKKGLHEYARGKASMSPISVVPQDAKFYFKEIDESAPKDIAPKKDLRTAVRADPDALNKPISITL